MDKVVYILCAATSFICVLLLLGSYKRTGLRLLFWSGAAFVCFTLTNVLLFVDLIIFPSNDFSVLRNSITLAGSLMLLYGLIWEST